MSVTFAEIESYTFTGAARYAWHDHAFMAVGAGLFVLSLVPCLLHGMNVYSLPDLALVGCLLVGMLGVMLSVSVGLCCARCRRCQRTLPAFGLGLTNEERRAMRARADERFPRKVRTEGQPTASPLMITVQGHVCTTYRILYVQVLATNRGAEDG